MPDWQAFQRYNNATQEYYGLWAYCQQSTSTFNSICKHWSAAADQLFNGTVPNFISTSEGLITTGMILLSLGLIAGVISAILPLLSYAAGVITLLAFLFLVIGVPIFGEDSNSLAKLQGATSYNKRYGFWLMIPTIILSFLGGGLMLATGYIYQKYGFGNLATHTKSKNPYGGSQLLGPPNAVPYGPNPPYLYPPGSEPLGPSLLSQYIAQRMPRYYAPSVVRPAGMSEFPQPSVARPGAQPAYVAPAYYRGIPPRPY